MEKHYAICVHDNRGGNRFAGIAANKKPIWATQSKCMKFVTIDEAVSWFVKNKKELLADSEDVKYFNLSTLAAVLVIACANHKLANDVLANTEETIRYLAGI